MKLISTVLIILLLTIGFSSCQKSSETKQPNIIFLLTDDQRFDALGAAGNDIIQTPHLDKLADEGIRFSNAYVTTSICAVSRASIFSGQYARRHGINDFDTHFSAEAWNETYPQLLKNAGYSTGFIGKYGVGKEEDLPIEKFDFWKGFPGFGYFEETDDDGNFIHLTRKMGNQSIEFLQEFAGEEKPFCLSVSFKAPHCQDGDPRQFIVDSAFMNILADVHIPEEPTNKDEIYNSFPEKFRERNEARFRWNLRFSTPEKYQEMVKNYYRLIYGVDQVVDRIRKELEELGVAENTIIIFTSDNGYYLGEYGLAGKWFGHDESIRVPLIIYDPRDESTSKVNEQMALNIDLAPTILDYAGVEIPQSMQGKSLLPFLNDKQDGKLRDEFFYEHQFIRAQWGHKPYIMGVEGVVQEDWKFMKYFHGGDTVVYEELFDRINDLDEMNNLIENEDFSSTKEKLDSKIQEYKKVLQ